jgi:phosphatidylinositol-4,5-bisphosphate 3-kinase catalytic subunit alpha/beta/delta
MKNLRHNFRFGLILEAYCRGIGSFLKVLSKQIEVIDVLSEISISFKSSKESLFQNRVCFLSLFQNFGYYLI